LINFSLQVDFAAIAENFAEQSVRLSFAQANSVAQTEFPAKRPCYSTTTI
jgi:hypothetical protein